MKGLKLFLTIVALVTLTATMFGATNYVITNDDNPNGNSATIFSVSKGSLSLVTTITTGGYGLGGGYFATGRVSVLRSKTQNCAYITDAYGPNFARPGDVASINMSTLTLVGTYPATALDYGGDYGIGLAENATGTFLFASYTGTGAIATYAQQPDCKLVYKSEVISVGAGYGGAIDGMRVTPNGKYLILGYSDGSIGSYAINAKTGALTLISRYLVTDGLPAGGVDLTADSKWALFGDASETPTVEVAPINANGSLGPTVGYALPTTAYNSNNVWLSPDETYVYVSNNASGQISAAPFDKSTGVINTAAYCSSAVLKNFYNGSTGDWYYLGSVVTGSAAGTGSPLYGAEWGGGAYASGIAIVNVKVKNGVCTLTEAKSSPASDTASDYVLTVGVDPPRKF